MNNLKFLLKLSGQHKIKLIFSALFSIISTTLSAVPYILIYNIILELFKETVDYKKIQNLVFITIIFVIIRVVTFVLSGIFSHVSAFNILYKIRIDLTEYGIFQKKHIRKIEKNY